ncbi:carbon starvation CstA family protein [Nonomuraea rubra]
MIFAGAVQDMVILFFSMRRNGRSLGQMAREEIGPVGVGRGAHSRCSPS